MKLKLIIFIALATMEFATAHLFSQAATIPEFAEVQAKYNDKVMLDVLRPHKLAVADLNAKFVAALDRLQEALQKTGSLDQAFAIKAEKEAILSGKYVPPQDGAKTPASLKTMRATYRAALGKLELDRDKKTQPLKEVYAKSLEALILTMTKSGKLEEAMALKKMRDELFVNPTLELSGESFTNSLGMRFVSLTGTNVLFCIHETRYKDYAVYASAEQGVDSSWKDQNVDGYALTQNAEDHPVINVSWEDAHGFCKWLSKREGKTYRLPTDEEWSIAVSLGDAEKRPQGTTPAILSGKENTKFPWGGDFPPKIKNRDGNYSDESRRAKAPRGDALYIIGYDDGIPTTAPVMNFKPNKFGIYDLAGNVWEWCEDFHDSPNIERVLRGGSWASHERGYLLSSSRTHHAPEFRGDNYGFRIVLQSVP